MNIKQTLGVLPALLVAQFVNAAEQQPPVTPAKKATPVHLAVSQTGELVGHLVDQQGHPLASGKVSLLKDGKVVATTQSNSKGLFVFRQVAAGKRTIKTRFNSVDVQLWAPATAPPSARKRFVLAEKPFVVRGNDSGSLEDARRILVIGAAGGGAIYWAIESSRTGS